MEISIYQLEHSLVLSYIDSFYELSVVNDLLSVKKSQIYDIDEKSRMLKSCGIVGVYQICSRYYLCSINSTTDVRCTVNSSPIFNVQQVDIIPIDSIYQSYLDDTIYINMIYEFYQQKSCYFSLEYDLTRSYQNQMNEAKGGGWKRVNSEFAWNYEVASYLIDNGVDNALVVPIIYGFINYFESFVNGDPVTFLLISRKNRHNPGMRYHARGVKDDTPANFVETEEILQTNDYYASYVQIRGSIPLNWSQYPHLNYNPKLVLADDQKNENTFRHDQLKLMEQYNHIIYVNLIDQKGSQLRVGSKYEEMFNKINSDSKNKFIWFDFHKICSKMRWNNLSKLLDMIKEDLTSFGYFSINIHTKSVISTQNGVARTNCMDNLDRTNVVQSIISRFMTLQMLHHPIGDDVLNSEHKEFERYFKNLWADNADRLSYLYTSTPAQKTDFTRTGKRSIIGALCDLKTSITRYYTNNFHEGYVQDRNYISTGEIKPISPIYTPISISTFLNHLFGLFLASFMLPLKFLKSDHNKCYSYIILFMTFSLTIGYTLLKGCPFYKHYVNYPLLSTQKEKKE